MQGLESPLVHGLTRTWEVCFWIKILVTSLEVKLTGGIRELVSDVKFGVRNCESFFTIEIPTTKISTSQARNQ